MLAIKSLPPEGKRLNQMIVTIDVEQCKGCGLCTAFCPQNILVLGQQQNSSGYPVAEITDVTACRGCLRCVLMCPDAVFTFAREEKANAKNDER